MNSSDSFANKISNISTEKKSNIVLALDPLYGTNNLFDYVCNVITKMSNYICAIKLNFHVILPLSITELSKITTIAHKANIQVIADLKLNDIFDTNKVAIQYLASIGFDSVIINPFIGKMTLKSTVDFAHSVNFGIISLVYMSHTDATEGYGSTIAISNKDSISETLNPIYRLFYDNSVSAGVDGVVVGGNRLRILKELSSEHNIRIPIYSPGLITQGGDIKKALEAGSKYLIIGRAILNSELPIKEILNIYNLIRDLKY